MKTPYLLLLAVLLTTTIATAQTKMVAHRSHSGSIETFDINGPGNFGETEEMRREAARGGILKVIRLSDTSSIQVYKDLNDTTYNFQPWNRPGVDLNWLHHWYPEIIFEGFDSTNNKSQSGLLQELPLHASVAPADSRCGANGVVTLGLLSGAAGLLVAGGIWTSRRRTFRS